MPHARRLRERARPPAGEPQERSPAGFPVGRRVSDDEDGEGAGGRLKRRVLKACSPAGVERTENRAEAPLGGFGRRTSRGAEQEIGRVERIGGGAVGGDDGHAARSTPRPGGRR